MEDASINVPIILEVLIAVVLKVIKSLMVLNVKVNLLFVIITLYNGSIELLWKLLNKTKPNLRVHL